MIETFTFEDILIEPKAFSTVSSRSLVDTGVNIHGIRLELPLISASMSVFDTLDATSHSIYYQFSDAISDLGGMHIFSRATLFHDRLYAAKNIAEPGNPVGLAVSLQEFRAYRSDLENLPDNIIVSIDVANGAIIESIKWHGQNPLIIGNFGNKLAMGRLDTGNVVYKAGIGSGAGCTTRVATGVGAPQAWLIQQMNKERKEINKTTPIISDGGVVTVADFVKSLALGADAVMVGKMLAATRESPWSPVKIDNKWYKHYRGMASSEEKGNNSHIEGASGYIPYEDKSLADVIHELKDGLTSAMSYTNSMSITDFHANADFLKVTNATRIENNHRLLLP